MLRRVIDDDTSMATTSRYDDDLVRTYVRTYIRTNRHAYVRTTYHLLLRTYVHFFYYYVRRRRLYSTEVRTYVRTTHARTNYPQEHLLPHRSTCNTYVRSHMLHSGATTYVLSYPEGEGRPWYVTPADPTLLQTHGRSYVRTYSEYARLESLSTNFAVRMYVQHHRMPVRTYGSTQYVRRTP